MPGETATPTPTLTPRPVASSVDELLRGASHREPFLTDDSKSGSGFERVVIDGERLVLKHVHPDRDWTMRFNDDVGCDPVQVWAAGLMDAPPDRIDHATVAVAGGLGRNGWGGAILMRDATPELVAPGDALLDRAAHAGYLDDMAGLSARMLGWRDTVGLVPLAARWGWFGPGASTRRRHEAGLTWCPGSRRRAGTASPSAPPGLLATSLTRCAATRRRWWPRSRRPR